jgi:hypothetical protein
MAMSIGENEGQTQSSGVEGHSEAGTVPSPRSGSRWADLSRFLGGRRHGHGRLIAVVAVVLVVAGGTGGYVALASSGVPASSHGGRAGLDIAGAPSTTSAVPSASGAGGADSDLAGSGSVACPMIPATPTNTTTNTTTSTTTNTSTILTPTPNNLNVNATTTAGGAVGADGGGGVIGSATHVFTRTTTDDVTIRTYRLAATGSCLCGPIPTSPPSSSGASASDVGLGSSLSVELSDDSAVGQGSLFEEPAPTATTGNAVSEPTAVVSGAFGVTEGAPVWWTAVTVGPDVATVEMTFADGSTDQMSPVDGVAVLAHLIDPSVASSGDGPYEVRGTLRLLGPSGAVIASVTIPEPTSTPPPGPATSPEPFTSPGLRPVSVPASPPSTVRGTTTTTVPTLVAPAATSGAVMACPDAVTPLNASAG